MYNCSCKVESKLAPWLRHHEEEHQKLLRSDPRARGVRIVERARAVERWVEARGKPVVRIHQGCQLKRVQVLNIHRITTCLLLLGQPWGKGSRSDQLNTCGYVDLDPYTRI